MADPLSPPSPNVVWSQGSHCRDGGELSVPESTVDAAGRQAGERILRVGRGAGGISVQDESVTYVETHTSYSSISKCIFYSLEMTFGASASR